LEYIGIRVTVIFFIATSYANYNSTLDRLDGHFFDLLINARYILCATHATHATHATMQPMLPMNEGTLVFPFIMAWLFMISLGILMSEFFRIDFWKQVSRSVQFFI